jgi:hypothetical protein
MTFLFICSFLFAINHMDIMTDIVGEHNNAQLGRISTTLDWNGDHYDDLILNSMWLPPELVGTPNLIPYGRINAYMGGPGFDNIPDVSMLGAYSYEYLALSMCNAGDMNGDGFDDLVEAVRRRHRDHRLTDCVVNLGAIATVENLLELVEVRVEAHTSLLLMDAAEAFDRIEREARVVATHRIASLS